MSNFSTSDLNCALAFKKKYIFVLYKTTESVLEGIYFISNLISYNISLLQIYLMLLVLMFSFLEEKKFRLLQNVVWTNGESK